MRVLRDLFARGVRHALLEGGPTLAAAFLDAGAVDRVDWFVAPLVLGAGPVALPDRPSSHGVDVGSVDVVGEDVHITGSIDYAEA
jgi:diaminohydroxyphosphoribosylaminopyrimidine deaminase/5-amino-6-(5-phosphoribosylamino)uracil reductase